jgi:hypothetical protein
MKKLMMLALAMALVAAIAVTSVLNGRQGMGMLAIVPLAILPPLGACMFYSRSLGAYSARTAGGLFSLAGGKFELGVPDIQVRPSSFPGFKAKPELQFNVRVLNVEL